MSEEKVLAPPNPKEERERLVETKNGTVAVAIHHGHLDGLIGRLMQMYELNGDREQREALKQETKWRCREWLNDHYATAGYKD